MTYYLKALKKDAQMLYNNINWISVSLLLGTFQSVFLHHNEPLYKLYTLASNVHIYTQSTNGCDSSTFNW